MTIRRDKLRDMVENLRKLFGWPDETQRSVFRKNTFHYVDGDVPPLTPHSSDNTDLYMMLLVQASQIEDTIA